MKIALGSDHGGYNLKAEIIKYLEKHNYEYEDFGAYNDKDSVDYPDYGKKVAEKVARGEFDRGILVCGTGIGISISANKVPGIRCALCHDVFSAKATREHNDSNILAMGERVIGKGHALVILDTWLNTSFEGGTHARRIEKITEIEKEYCK